MFAWGWSEDIRTKRFLGNCTCRQTVNCDCPLYRNPAFFPLTDCHGRHVQPPRQLRRAPKMFYGQIDCVHDTSINAAFNYVNIPFIAKRLELRKLFVYA